MLSLSNNKIAIGTKIRLPEEWRQKLVNFSGKYDYPIEYTLKEIKKDSTTLETYYVLDNGVILTAPVIHYLLGDRVVDENDGKLFKNYIPEEHSKILISNILDADDIIPSVLRFRPELVELGGKSYVCMNLFADYLTSNDYAPINRFMHSSKKYQWKLIDNSDQSSMSQYEMHFCDTIMHREFVLISCEKLAHYLEYKGAKQSANDLRARGKVHDLSKLTDLEEMHELATIVNDKSSLISADNQLSEVKKEAIRRHWKNNDHHPEHFEFILDMPRISQMEMCCDWYARSMQYYSPNRTPNMTLEGYFLDFVKKQQEKRFRFPSWFFEECMAYCKILTSNF